MAYSVHLPWYATGFRGDKLEAALAQIAPVALKYGASHYSVYRSQDDLYKFIHISDFETKAQWQSYWEGPEFIRFRTLTSGWWQVPILYAIHERVAEGSMPHLVDHANADHAA